jgi:hypothetical protein
MRARFNTSYLIKYSWNKMFNTSNLSRLRIIKWLLDKLLTSLVTSFIIYIGPIIGINFNKLSFGYIYTIITIATLFVSVVVYFLVPKETSTELHE